MRFPDGFLWGASTSAYQIEGAVAEDGRKRSNWDVFSHTPGRIAHGETADVACNHYHRWEEDLDLAAAIGLRAYRFSIAWPRVVPDGRGAVNERGLDFYRRLLDGLGARGITPVVQLHHWDLPEALARRGGWLARETVDAFGAYAEVVLRALGDRAPVWITQNEPWIVCVLGYYLGLHAPGLRDLRLAVRAMHHVLLAHGRATRVYRALGLTGSVGITLNLLPAYPETDSQADHAAAHLSDGFTNRWYLDALYRAAYPEDLEAVYRRLTGPLDFIEAGDMREIAEPTDFLGVNYYARRLVRADAAAPFGHRVVDERQTGLPLTDDGTGIYPDGLRDCLVRVARDYGAPPLTVTENGCVCWDRPDEEGRVEDQGRIAYLRAHIAAAGDAIAAGADLRGYLVWSLLDNFEWSLGYARRYGLVHVDYGTLHHTPKTSAAFYRDVITRNGP